MQKRQDSLFLYYQTVCWSVRKCEQYSEGTCLGGLRTGLYSGLWDALCSAEAGWPAHSADSLALELSFPHVSFWFRWNLKLRRGFQELIQRPLGVPWGCHLWPGGWEWYRQLHGPQSLIYICLWSGFRSLYDFLRLWLVRYLSQPLDESDLSSIPETFHFLELTFWQRLLHPQPLPRVPGRNPFSLWVGSKAIRPVFPLLNKTLASSEHE